MPGRPIVVLVHGAFADASGWAGVFQELSGDDVEVLAVANPLRGLAADAASIRSVLDTLDGPVVLVGHSYGGAVISQLGHPKVRALVYVNAYALEEGETLAQLQGRFADSLLAQHLVFTPVEGGAPDVSVDIEAFPEVFAADVPRATTVFLAHAQRPLSAAAFEEPSGPPAWRDKPSWGIVSSSDNTINPEVERFGYERAAMTVTDIEGASHAVFVSRPADVATVIRAAIGATVPA